MQGSAMPVTTAAKSITLIPPKAEFIERERAKEYRQLRTAAYCRVSTDSEEQELSYELQKEVYTEKIMSNPKWRLVEIFADEGITATSTKRRKDFNKMISWCKQGKIDQIITKSFSRFARNTVDSLAYVRMLKEMGIGIIFEKECINTLEVSNEFIITIYSSLAQGESESHSGNVKWGKRKIYKSGKVSFHYKNFLGYKAGENKEPVIVPEEAAVVRRIYERFLAGESRQVIADGLSADGILTPKGKTEWTSSTVHSILTNEKYVGDAILQKTFVADCLSGRIEKNIGQLPQYYVENNHQPIIEREEWKRVQEEVARRSSKRKVNDVGTKTELGKYSGKYALTELLICGECGTPYRRVTWKKNGKTKIVWRCISRLGHGKKYCKNSPSLEETIIQDAVIGAIKDMAGQRTEVFETLKMHIGMGIAAARCGNDAEDAAYDKYSMQVRISEIEAAVRELIETDPDGCGSGLYDKQFESLYAEKKDLQGRLDGIAQDAATEQDGEEKADYEKRRLNQIFDAVDGLGWDALCYDESLVRQMIECIRVVSKEKLRITFRWGAEADALMKTE